MTKTLKRILVALLMFGMILSLMPTFIYAEEKEEIVTEEQTEEQEEVTTAEEEKIQEEEVTKTEEESTEEAKEEKPSLPTLLKSAPKKLLAASNDTGCYLDVFIVKSQKDGTAPWDTNDEDGNDSNDSNGIVRTFDNCMYTFEYTTALSGDDTVDEADIQCEFVLNDDIRKVEFDMDTLAWMLDKKITYHYSDGTSSTTLNRDKTVVKQVLTGRRHIQNSSTSNAIPGVGTLVCGVKAKAAKAGDILKPTFSVWISGDDKKTIEGNEITVSAEPRYNISLRRNGNLSYLAYWNPETMEFSATKEEGYKYGRYLGYVVTVQLYNNATNKGLKGIEMPSGEITYDFSTKATVNGEDVTHDEHYPVLLYDYKENDWSSAKYNSVGYNGVFKGYNGNDLNAIPIYSINWGSYGPKNSGGVGKTANKWGYCYDGGNIHLEKDTTDSNLYHLTVKDYDFDWENFMFPTRMGQNDTRSGVSFPDYIGSFSAGAIGLVSCFPDTEEKEEYNLPDVSNILFTATIGNLHGTSVSGKETNIDRQSNDNSVGFNFTTYMTGTWTKWQYLYQCTGTTGTGTQVNLSKASYSSGDPSASWGQNVLHHSLFSWNGDGYINAANLLQKFDDECYDVPYDKFGRYPYVNKSNPLNEIGDWKLLYAAKPDKTGWVDDDEMRDTHEEDLVYFTSIFDLKDAGYTCVGFLWELRNGKYYSNSGTNTMHTMGYTEVKPTAEVGKVYADMIEAKLWRDDVNTWSYTDSPDGDHYWSGEGAPGYPATTLSANSTYKKTVYENGTIVGGHTGGYIQGQSLLIIGDKASVSVKSRNEENTLDKSVFDMDAGERTATFRITPSLSSNTANSELIGSFTDNVKVTATLPKDLTYVLGSASLSPSSYVENADGTSILTWEIPGCTVDENITPIDIQCIIGHAGTKEDVSNNQKITIKTAVTADKDPRAQTINDGNAAESTISVIRLAATSISKSVDKPLLNKNMDFTYSLYYGNNAEENANGIQIYDEMPYSGDANGSDYHGSYTISKVEVNFSSAPKTLSSWDGILGTGNRGQNIKNSLAMTTLPAGTLNGTKLTWDNLNISPQALILKFSTLWGQEYISMNITCHPTGNKADDAYVNRFRQNASNQAAPVISNVVRSQVVNRSIKGLIFNDRDVSGTRNDQDVVISGRTVKLYSKANNGGTAYTYNGVTYYPAKDMDGNDVSTTATSTNGEYSFTNLADGDYIVVTSSLGDFLVTEKNVGSDSTVDSDAEKVNSDAVIGIITLPELEDMTSTHYITEHNDIGLYLPTRQVTIKKNVTGNLGDVTKEFEFALQLDSSQRVPWTKGTTAGVYMGSKFEFKLKDEESVTVELPIGAKYTLSEGACDHVGSYTITSNAANPIIAKRADANIISDKKLSTATETVDGADGDITISVVNERNLAVKSGTAYRTDFVIVGAGILLGIIALLARRRAVHE